MKTTQWILLLAFALTSSHAFAWGNSLCGTTAEKLDEAAKDESLNGSYNGISTIIQGAFTGSRGTFAVFMESGVLKIAIRRSAQCRETYPIKLCINPVKQGVHSLKVTAYSGVFSASAKVVMKGKKGKFNGFTLTNAKSAFQEFQGDYKRSSQSVQSISALRECGKSTPPATPN